MENSRKVILKRFKESSQGVLGHLITMGFEAHTIELPWKDNKPKVSCIPVGKYKCIYRYSTKYKGHYHVTGVPNRSWILTHNGTFAGDVEEGFKTHSEGCIIIGKYHGKVDSQDAVLLSRVTLRKFVEVMGKKLFELEVQL